MEVDLAPYLMGDPIAAYRRPPTVEEIERLDRRAEERRRGPYTYQRKVRESRGLQLPKDLRLLTLQVGESIDFSSKVRAESSRAWMYRNFQQCSVRRLSDGKYWLRRVA